MAQTIAPAVREAERRRLLRAHVVGLLAGAVTLALALTLAGEAVAGVPAVHNGMALALAAAGVLWTPRLVAGRGPRYPRPRWQVPEIWRQQFPAPFTALAYGALLGAGCFTDVVFPLYWLLAALTVLLADVQTALLAWAAYAAVRAATTRSAVLQIVAAPMSITDVRGPRGLRVSRWLGAGLMVALAIAVVAGVLEKGTVG